ncbi:putative Sulfotransferase domain, P-loop containing nucleoside triphosphate hydrolase [Helianthus anomalus]
MLSSQSLSITNESKQDAEYNKICEEYKHLMKTLPKGNGWRVQHLYNYNGFWLDSDTLKTNMILNTYFKTQPTDIFLASFMKTGTTWLKALMFSIINRHRYTFSDHYLHHHGPKQWRTQDFWTMGSHFFGVQIFWIGRCSGRVEKHNRKQYHN